MDPTVAASRLRDWGGLTFLDSAMRHETLGRFSYVAADPFGRFVVSGGRPGWNGTLLPEPPLVALAAKLAEFSQPTIPDLPPFQGGAAGYFAYEFGNLLERPPAMAARGAMPEAEWLFYDLVCAFDHGTERAWIISTGLPTEGKPQRALRAQERAALCEATLLEEPGLEPLSAPHHPIEKTDWESNFNAPTYAGAVGRVVEAILAGDIFQANIAQRFTAVLPQNFDAWTFYRRLRASNPAPFAAFLERDGLVIASSSPERFVTVSGHSVETRPIKGTAPRSTDPEADRRLADVLQASEKDRAENTMIVDLLRNDLSRVCLPHTVLTPALLALESYAGVHHLVSTVTGVLAPGLTVTDVVAAAFPGGSITGAPKLKAMEIIDAIEGEPRGIYCGAIGFLGLDGRSDLNVAIRTVLLKDGMATFGVGGGVTALSDPAAEYDETLVKAEKLFRAFAGRRATEDA